MDDEFHRAVQFRFRTESDASELPPSVSTETIKPAFVSPVVTDFILHSLTTGSESSPSLKPIVAVLPSSLFDENFEKRHLPPVSPVASTKDEELGLGSSKSKPVFRPSDLSSRNTPRVFARARSPEKPAVASPRNLPIRPSFSAMSPLDLKEMMRASIISVASFDSVRTDAETSAMPEEGPLDTGAVSAGGFAAGLPHESTEERQASSLTSTLSASRKSIVSTAPEIGLGLGGGVAVRSLDPPSGLSPSLSPAPAPRRSTFSGTAVEFGKPRSPRPKLDTRSPLGTLRFSEAVLGSPRRATKDTPLSVPPCESPPTDIASDAIPVTEPVTTSEPMGAPESPHPAAEAVTVQTPAQPHSPTMLSPYEQAAISARRLTLGASPELAMPYLPSSAGSPSAPRAVVFGAESSARPASASPAAPARPALPPSPKIVAASPPVQSPQSPRSRRAPVVTPASPSSHPVQRASPASSPVVPSPVLAPASPARPSTEKRGAGQPEHSVYHQLDRLKTVGGSARGMDAVKACTAALEHAVPRHKLPSFEKITVEGVAAAAREYGNPLELDAAMEKIHVRGLLSTVLGLPAAAVEGVSDSMWTALMLGHGGDCIDGRALWVALAMAVPAARPTDRHKLLFSLFDTDRNGYLDEGDLVALLHCALNIALNVLLALADPASFRPQTFYSLPALEALARVCFQVGDIADGDEISLSEWIQAADLCALLTDARAPCENASHFFDCTLPAYYQMVASMLY